MAAREARIRAARYQCGAELLKLVKTHLKIKWDWRALTRNPLITWEHVQAHPNLPWNWEWLSMNPNITWEHVQARPDLPWNWEGLSFKPNVTWEHVQAHPDLPWCWDRLSWNPNITWELVQAHPNKPWTWEELSANPFESGRARVCRRHLAAYRIQRRWRRAVTDPTHRLCKRAQWRRTERPLAS
jgi:hypothetical protein